MCFSYTRESRLSIQPNFRRSDDTSFDHHGIRSFNGAYDRSRNQQMRNSSARGTIVIASEFMGAVCFAGQPSRRSAISAQMVLAGTTLVWMLAFGSVGPFGEFRIPSLRWECGFRPNLEILGIAFTTDG